MNCLKPKLKKKKVYFEDFSSGQQQQQQQSQQQQQQDPQQQQLQQQDSAGKKCLRPHIYDGMKVWGKMPTTKKTKQVVRNKAIKTDKYEIFEALKIQLKEAAYTNSIS